MAPTDTLSSLRPYAEELTAMYRTTSRALPRTSGARMSAHRSGG